MAKNSHAYRIIIIWFALNPEVPMTVKDFAGKLNAEEKHVRRSLKMLAQRGFLSVEAKRSPNNRLQNEFTPGLLLIEELER